MNEESALSVWEVFCVIRNEARLANVGRGRTRHCRTRWVCKTALGGQNTDNLLFPNAVCICPSGMRVPPRER